MCSFEKLLQKHSLKGSLKLKEIGSILAPSPAYWDKNTGGKSVKYDSICKAITPSSISNFRNSKGQMYGDARILYDSINDVKKESIEKCFENEILSTKYYDEYGQAKLKDDILSLIKADILTSEEDKMPLLGSFDSLDGGGSRPLSNILAHVYLFVVSRQIGWAQSKSSLDEHRAHKEKILSLSKKLDAIHSQMTRFCEGVANFYICVDDEHLVFDSTKIEADISIKAQHITDIVIADECLVRDRNIMQKCKEILFIMSAFHHDIAGRVMSARQYVVVVEHLYGEVSFESVYALFRRHFLEFLEYYEAGGNKRIRPRDIFKSKLRADNILKKCDISKLEQFKCEMNPDILNAIQKNPKIDLQFIRLTSFIMKFILMKDSPKLKYELEEEDIEGFREFDMDFDEYFFTGKEEAFLESIIVILRAEKYPESLPKIHEKVIADCPKGIFHHI